MYKLKAFGVIAPLIDNTVSVVAPIGELSPIAKSYAREKEYYSNSAAPGHSLVVFSSKLDGGVQQTDVLLASDLLMVNKWCYEQAVAGTFNTTTESFRVAFLNQFGEEYDIWLIGEMVQIGNNQYMPSVIEIRDAVNDELQYRIWYSSAVFEQQFDEYEIIVVPPVEDLEMFFQSGLSLQADLEDMTQDQLMERIMAAKNDYPESYLQADMYEWYDPLDPQDTSLRIPTYWTSIIYGIAGRNVDAIKDAIREFILENSERNREEWSAILPEVFTSTEFLFVPMWKNYSIPNRELEQGLYSPVTRMFDGVSELVRLTRGEGYTDQFITEHAEVLGSGFKSISLMVTGGPYNRDGVVSLYQRYPDYINVDTTSLDFSRMAPETRRFVLTMLDMLSVAESMTPDSIVPVKFTRLVREGVLYVSCTLDRFTLIVTSKYSAEDPSLLDPGDDQSNYI
jgi:hypothetical protein